MSHSQPLPHTYVRRKYLALDQRVHWVESWVSQLIDEILGRNSRSYIAPAEARNITSMSTELRVSFGDVPAAQQSTVSDFTQQVCVV